MLCVSQPAIMIPSDTREQRRPPHCMMQQKTQKISTGQQASWYVELLPDALGAHTQQSAYKGFRDAVTGEPAPKDLVISDIAIFLIAGDFSVVPHVSPVAKHTHIVRLRIDGNTSYLYCIHFRTLWGVVGSRPRGVIQHFHQGENQHRRFTGASIPQRLH